MAGADAVAKLEHATSRSVYAAGPTGLAAILTSFGESFSPSQDRTPSSSRGRSLPQEPGGWIAVLVGCGPIGEAWLKRPAASRGRLYLADADFGPAGPVIKVEPSGVPVTWRWRDRRRADAAFDVLLTAARRRLTAE